MEEYEALEDYEPQTVTDGAGFEPFKCTKTTAQVNSARIEMYSGEREDLVGKEFYRYELEILDHVEHAGRRLWKSVDLSNPDRQKQLADIMHTVGLRFKNREQLENISEEFVKMLVRVSAWAWTPDKADIDPDTQKPRQVQMHKITGIVEEQTDGVNPTPF